MFREEDYKEFWHDKNCQMIVVLVANKEEEQEQV